MRKGVGLQYVGDHLTAGKDDEYLRQRVEKGREITQRQKNIKTESLIL